MRGRAGGGPALTLFNILRTAGESGAYRIFPISRGLTEFHTILVTGLDSRVCIRALQNGAEGGGISQDRELNREEGEEKNAEIEEDKRDKRG